MIVRQVMSLVIIAFCLTFIGIVIFQLKRKSTKYPSNRQNPAYQKPKISQDIERSAPVKPTDVIRSLDNTPIVLSKGNLPGLKFDPIDELSVNRLPSLVSGNDGNPLNNAAPVVHQLASTGVVNGVVVSSLRGVYSATVDPSNLIQYADGTLSSIQKGVHGFGPHAGFHSINPAKVFSPILVFQIASIITGQYYLNGITKQLKAIAGRLEYIIAWQHTEKEGQLRSFYERLTKLSKLTSYALEDATELSTIKRESLAIRRHYELLLNRINENEIAPTAFLAGRKIDQLGQKVNELAPSQMLDCILAAQRIENIAKYVELRCNLGLAVSDPTRLPRIKDQLMDIKINNNDSLLDSVLPKYKRIMEKCITTADRLHSETWRGKKENEAKKLLRVYKSEKANLLSRYEEISDEYNSISEYIRERMEKPVDIVLISDTDGNFTATQLLAR